MIALACATPASAVSFAFDFRATVLSSDLDIFPLGFTSDGRVEVIETSPGSSVQMIVRGTLSIAGLPLTLEDGFVNEFPGFWRLEQFFQCDPCFVDGASQFGFTITMAPGDGTFLPPEHPTQTFAEIFFFNSLATVGSALLDIEVVPEPGRSVAWLGSLAALAALRRPVRA